MTNSARFTELLFADQTLDELSGALSGDESPAYPDVWKQLIQAADYLRRNKQTQATELLLTITKNPSISTRMLLWGWTALRQIGIRPQPSEASEIRGVVIQVPVEQGADVLAVYADGTARYVNHSGKIIVWESTDAKIARNIQEILDLSKAIDPNSSEDIGGTASGVVRVTLLTFNGNLFVDVAIHLLQVSPVNSVLTRGAELIRNLIQQTEAMNKM